jgi:hypothetical protein
MTSRVLRYAALSFLLATSWCATVPAAVEAPQIHVFSCQVVAGPLLPQRDEVGLIVRFENESSAELSSIVLRANYGMYPVDFIDDGTFAPKVQIDNFLAFERGTTYFNASAAALDLAELALRAAPSADMWKSNMALVPWLGTEDPQNCTIVRVIAADGDVWQNPAVPQSVPNIPTPAPKPSGESSVTRGPVELVHCQVAVDGPLSRGFLRVAFRSEGDRPADTIVFRGSYEGTGLDFSDRGTFSHDTLVTHLLKLSLPDALKTRMYAGFDEPQSCVVVSVHYSDGTSWNNDAIPATPGALPTPVPNALVLVRVKPKWQRHSMPTPMPTSSSSPAPGTPR